MDCTHRAYVNPALVFSVANAQHGFRPFGSSKKAKVFGILYFEKVFGFNGRILEKVYAFY
jgi:hypothetical protein